MRLFWEIPMRNERYNTPEGLRSNSAQHSCMFRDTLPRFGNLFVGSSKSQLIFPHVTAVYDHLALELNITWWYGRGIVEEVLT